MNTPLDRTLEQFYNDGLIWEESFDIQKSRTGAPIGTVKVIGNQEYIKTTEGWKYKTKGKKVKTGESTVSKIGKKISETTSNIAKKITSLFKPGHKVTAKDGTKGDIVGVNEDTGTVKIKYQDKETGKEKVVDVNGDKLKNNIDTGNVKHNNNQDVNDKEKISNKETSSTSDKKDIEKTNETPKKEQEKKINEIEPDISVKDSTPVTEEQFEPGTINHKFAAFSRYARSVIKGRMKSMIAYGSGGVGKTFTCIQELNKAGKKPYDPEVDQPGDDTYDYVKITGKMTTASVYENMYKHNGKILLFDDCDSVLQDPNAINLFKGALDTSGDGTIDWGSQRKIKDANGEEIPEKFPFKGRCIFISNLDIKNGKDAKSIQPIVSRGFGIDLTMSPSETIDRIEHIAKTKDGQLTNLKFPGIDKYTSEDMKEVLNYMRKNKDSASDLNVRTVGALLAIKQEAESDRVKDWTKEADYHFIKHNNLEKSIYSGKLLNNKTNNINYLYLSTRNINFSKKIQEFKNSIFSKEIKS